MQYKDELWEVTDCKVVKYYQGNIRHFEIGIMWQLHLQITCALISKIVCAHFLSRQEVRARKCTGVIYCPHNQQNTEATGHSAKNMK